MVLTGLVASDDEKSLDNISANSAEIGDAYSLDSSSITDDKLQILIKYESTQSQSFWAYGFTIVLGIISVVCFHDLCLSPLNSNLLQNDLAGKGVYDVNDFENNAGILVPYWNNGLKKTKVEFNGNKEGFAVGPCYLQKGDLNWPSEKNEFSESRKSIQYRESQWQDAMDDGDLTGLCRPGFIIIGAGKCGTSSLYHYLVGHPRVLPAKKKQIDYFRYFSTRSMKWYLSNFPSADTFLSNGALMTGEASPGYLPYPDIAHKLKTQMTTEAGPGTPKIITIVRSPLERSWSSYKYNYKKPVIDAIRKKYDDEHADPFMDKLQRTDKCYTDEWYYEKYVFSFEEMVRAELKLLRECLTPGGRGEEGTRDAYGSQDWAAPELERRQRHGESALISLDASCYGDRISDAVPRRQWTDLVEEYPDKMINLPNLHVVQSLVGRSLYTLPLEWWYALYPREDLHIICNEDLRYKSNESMSNVTEFLGLPPFDFSEVTGAGMFNTGGNTGYDTVTKWDESTGVAASTDDIPISAELRKEYMEFVQPFNERLFQLIGKRCNW
mmetsp:Transcript_16231/g.30699  ORF Transcript_16231/g.30699 Transcript_16231/m.30699 type:complete len:553 (+) Transcript_16231:4385-6043(+)